MRYVKAIVVGLIAWRVLVASAVFLSVFAGETFVPGSAFHNALDLVMLPVGLWLGWRFANRKRPVEPD